MNKLEYPEHETVVYLEADINYTIFHLSDGKKIVSSFTLKKHDKDYCKKGFLRVNKSFLLNPNFIKNYEQEGKIAYISLINGTQIPVSRRRRCFVKKNLYLN
jgi:DNA-binding LytR/AlgR family response regulator